MIEKESRVPAGTNMVLTGEHFLKEGLISPEQLNDAMSKQRDLDGKESIARILVQLGYVTERDRVKCQGKVWGVAFADVTEIIPRPEALSMMNSANARKFKALPMERQGNRLLVAMVNPLDIFAIDEIRLTTGLDVEPLIAVEADLINGLVQFYRNESEALAGVLKDFDEDQVVDIKKKVEEIEEEAVAEPSSQFAGAATGKYSQKGIA